VKLFSLTQEIAIDLGALVVNKSIQVAGDALNQDIIQYMYSRNNMRIPHERTLNNNDYYRPI